MSKIEVFYLSNIGIVGVQLDGVRFGHVSGNLTRYEIYVDKQAAIPLYNSITCGIKHICYVQKLPLQHR